MPAEPVPPNNGMTPSTVGAGLFTNEQNALAFLQANAPTLVPSAQDYIDVFHIGHDYEFLGNATAAGQDPTPFWNQLFTDFSATLQDFQKPTGTITPTLADFFSIGSVPAGGGGTPISQIAYGLALQNYASAQFGHQVFHSPNPIMA